MRGLALLAVPVVLALAACAQPGQQYIPSKKSAVELRTIQTRVVPADYDATMRAVIETMQDLGYRVTRVSPEAGVVSGTRVASLRLAAVVQEREPELTAVRANASVVSPVAEAQVDSPEFYAQNFFRPLEATLGRDLSRISETDQAPEAARPIAEINTMAEREARAEAEETSE